MRIVTLIPKCFSERDAKIFPDTKRFRVGTQVGERRRRPTTGASVDGLEARLEDTHAPFCSVACEGYMSFLCAHAYRGPPKERSKVGVIVRR